MEKIRNYIDGELVPPLSGHYIDNINPAEGKVYSMVPDSDDKDVDMAVEAAKKAFPTWSTMPVARRSEIMINIARLIEERLQALAQAESVDNGKPVKLASIVDIPRASANFQFYATCVQHFASEFHQTDDQAINYTLREPLGVVGCISPWNLPLYLFTWKIAPALAAGNCVVAKPSEMTPMTAYLLSQICIDAGLPAGVLNIVHGLGAKAGEAIVSHVDVKAISFTGGTNTGKHISAIAAPMFKKLSLELGGKNPNIIFADADFDEAIETSIKSSFSNQGEICLCGSRILVERSIYDKFLEAFLEKSKSLTVGDPNDPNTKVGALVSKAHMDKVLSYVELAREEGGAVLFGGERLHLNGRCADGFFVAPTIITGLDHKCRTNQEEIFGPVVTIMPFDTEDQAVEFANSTAYGLSATIWTQHLKRAHNMARRLSSGIIWINCWLLRDLRTPFGGVKNSGVGREGGFEALKFFTEEKNVCIKL
ncbi:MAG: aldehyde dehydrogenase [Bacteroidota bacterium]